MSVISLLSLIISTNAVPERCNYYGNVYQVYPVDVCNSDFGQSQIGRCNPDDTVEVEYYDSNNCQGTPDTDTYDCTLPNLCDCSANGNGANTLCDSLTLKYCDCADDPQCTNPVFDITIAAEECIRDGEGGSVWVSCNHPNLTYTYYPNTNDCSDDPSDVTEFTFDYKVWYGDCSVLTCNAAGPGNGRNRAGNRVNGPPNGKKEKAMAAMRGVIWRNRAQSAHVKPVSLVEHYSGNGGGYGMYEFLLLNVGVSVVTCLVVIACILTVWFGVLKCRNKNKKQYSFEKVEVDEEEDMIEDK